MAIENFVWDQKNQSVSWLHNGNAINERFKDLHFASVNTKDSYVYVEAGKNFSQDQVCYLSFEGKRLFSFDKSKGKISWLMKNRPVEVDCANIVSAQLYSGPDIVVAVNGSSRAGRRLTGFRADGTLIFEREPPEGYSFMYLSSGNGLPSVICEGGKDKADSHGRNSWHFAIDPKTGNLSKQGLAY